MNTRAFKSVIVCCFILVLAGILIVNNSMPQFVKDRSNFSIDCSFSPFDLKIETQNYTVDMNGSSVYDIKDSSVRAVMEIGENVKDKMNAAADSTEKIFQEIKSNIGQ